MTDEHIDRRTYLAGLGAAGIAGLAGCSRGGVAAQTGTLATRVTDQPGDIADFESCVVTIVGVWLGPPSETNSDGTANETDSGGTDDGDGGEDGEREYLEFDEPQEADLVDLQGENTQLVDERELPTGEHSYLQLDTDGVEATLDSGESATVEVPGNAPLKFNEPFEIRANTRTVFTADFTPVKRGQSGSYNLQPVASGVTVEYEEIEAESDGNETESSGTGSGGE
ncbi:DUF4382 domain-containing protein [Halovenus sp. WSH3]|uniref:DUF4382 domain-containing protein n=1 Tax=Halovenus carboxidivorans TaxID=2692199 RepID=A0A6B0TG65_9EURY|nr:DUF4382 domain-containing protein [Halovenus carboxidivorans]MXR52179.1 DUF4382 domain-containing protein [Halovenus carboxidivorans]